MPRGYIVPVEDTNYNAMLARLTQEWERPDPNATEPIIIETSNSLRPQQTPTQLYVIWSEWRDLMPRRRSEMMMDAYIATRGRSSALNVTLAMGLTPQEADNLGIKYQTEANA